ncbi:hypothetical protein LG201_11990 [Methylobacillus gramineus]|uniref:hypothetical protein n=1 Tax=Methylobacillus gramineus TaxID=755169 RepID=UPI001CFFC2EB|nr:hypothetical protein [Methylobacillus gramineus]MCB5185924.1 hypothetical protein [Methylobacillus gramineus]
MKTLLIIASLLALNACTPGDTSGGKIAENQRAALEKAKDAGHTLEQAAQQREQQINESTTE